MTFFAGAFATAGARAEDKFEGVGGLVPVTGLAEGVGGGG